MESYLPTNVAGITEDDIRCAQEILKDQQNYIVRYLREWPKAVLSTYPVRNAHTGELIEDLFRRRMVVAQGVPFACLAAFEFNGHLYIGWSKLSTAKDEEGNLIETKPFSKKSGRAAAVLRGLKDTISFNGNHVVSACSSIIPQPIARKLRGFIEYAEGHYEDKAINVGYPELTPAVQAPTAKALVAGMSTGAL